ncbi:1-phosphofructokinase [Caldalkalibacillus mannanilyticus]|uniref:1-phosphofructokinase n=1 Tax=Caldalkalibacillus mannanilyticus TaxID=1418 RepID=UPI00046894BF|nr:1-phosphofructokinase [Caldalkalibacillus mannanilyticus]
MSLPIITVTLNPAIDKTITVPQLELGSLNRVLESRTDPGGKGINVAKVLKHFDMKVLATGFIAGIQGKQLLQYLEEEEIPLDFVQVQGETRTNLKVIDESTSITTEINENGFDITENQLEMLKEKLNGILDQASLLVLGGSFPPGVPQTIYQEYIQLAHSKGIRTILDADGIALREGIKAKPYAIKPNIHELEQLVGYSLESEEEIIQAGRKLIDQGISIVIISMGAQGALCLDQHEAYRILPFPITAKSTVGAGDSMVGALSYSLLQQFSLREMAVWTTTAGTITASKSGTQVCTFQEVKDSLEKVHLSKIQNKKELA